MASTIIDKLTTVFDFETDTAGIVKAERAIEKFIKKVASANEMLGFLKNGLEFEIGSAGIVSAERNMSRLTLETKAAVENVSKLDKKLAFAGRRNSTSSTKNKETVAFTQNPNHQSDIVGFLKRSLAFVGITFAIDKITSYANQWDNVQNKLKSVGLSGVELASVFDKLMNSSNAAGVSINTSVELFQQLSANMGDVLDKKGLLTLVDNLNKVFAINATSATSAKQAMLDLAKGLESATVNYQEIKRALQDVPGLAGIVNRHFKSIGTTTKKALQGGAFASKDFIKVLIDAKKEIDSQFGKIGTTVPMAISRMNNSFVSFFGVLRTNSGATDFFVAGISGVGKAMDIATDFFKKHTTTVKAIMVTLVSALVATLSVLSVALVPFLITPLLIGAALAVVVLGMDDLMTAMTGGNSILGDGATALGRLWKKLEDGVPIIKKIRKAIEPAYKTTVASMVSEFSKEAKGLSFFGGKGLDLFKRQVFGGKALGLFKPQDYGGEALDLFKRQVGLFKSLVLGGFERKNTKKMLFKSEGTIAKQPYANLGKEAALTNFPLQQTSNFLPAGIISPQKANNNVSFHDASTTNMTVEIPAGISHNDASTMIAAALDTHKQKFRMGALNSDSTIKR